MERDSFEALSDGTRRSFLGLLGIGGAAYATGQSTLARESDSGDDSTDDGLDSLSFYSAASQIAPDRSELDDDETVVVRAEPSAYNFETTDDGPGTTIYEDSEIPLVSEDGQVVGIGTVDFVSDDQGGFDVDNEEFLLNLFDAKMGGEGTVLWDEGHDQFEELALEYYDSFRQYAGDFGYELQATTNLLGGAALTFPSTASQTAPDGGPLTDDSRVVVWAEPTATNVDDEGDEAAHLYEDEPIPLVSRDGPAVGIGTPELIGDGDLTEQNEQFALNLLADTIGESGTVLWDDAHDTFYDSSAFGEFADAIEREGYEFTASETLLDGDGGGISELEFFSTASLLDADGEPLTDDSLVAVWAEPTATNVDENDDGLVEYPDDTEIPLVAADGSVVGVGADLATDDSDVDANRSFLVNAWEDRIGGAGTVLYDEGHGQTLTLDDYDQLRTAAEDRGFAVEPTTDLTSDLDDADAVMLTTPSESFPDDELSALADFAADGGSVFVHDEADFDGHETETLNEIAAALDAGFRFNSDQVIDEENSGWAPFVLRTSNVNDEFAFFGDTGDEDHAIDAADAIAIPSPSEPYTDAELAALDDHLADGGALFLFDESEFTNEETANLNAIAESLDLGFRFNADQVEDDERNDGVSFVPTTTNVNDGFDVFDGLDDTGLDEADGLVVTSPSESFTDGELDALSSFVADGGALFLFDESDFGAGGGFGFDETENLNEIADALDLAFRFNSDQVNDGDGEFDVETTNFTSGFEYFEEREASIGIEFDPDEAYYGRVVRVFDGDTFEVEFDSEYDYRDVIRHIGIDTSETPPAENEPEEWFGIGEDDEEHLYEWGSNASNFSVDLMTPDGTEIGEGDVEGRRVKLTFDPDEPTRGNFGRLLSYMYYDPDEFAPEPGDGSFSVNYNLETIEKGYARVYSSGFSKHDEWSSVEEEALAARRGIWGPADFDALDEIRNEPVEDVFVPEAVAVESEGTPLADDRVPVTTEETAERDGTAESDVPLVAVDERAGVAMVGGLMIHEQYELAEGFPVDTSGYGNFPLLTNLADQLGTSSGDVLIEGGHGQFNADGSISLERAQFYLRYLEGVGTRLRQVNDLPTTLPQEDETPRAVLITPPAEPFERDEIDALRSYLDDGGSVVLFGSANATPEARTRLNELATRLNTDLRLSDDEVTDPESNVADDPAIVETSAFDESIPIFGPYVERDPDVAAYLRTIAGDDGIVDDDALAGAIDDWSNDRIDRTYLDAAIEANERGTPVAGA